MSPLLNRATINMKDSDDILIGTIIGILLFLICL